MCRILRRALFTLAAAGSAYCQSQEGSLIGIVTDSTRAAIPGAKITIRNIDTNISETTETSQAGTYTVLHLPRGTYEPMAERQDFRNYRARISRWSWGKSSGKILKCTWAM